MTQLNQLPFNHWLNSCFNTGLNTTPVLSRMRSEGFPFIVGVWGWTCVRVVLVGSSSCRRRVVVASSSPTRRQLVNFSPLGGTHALRHNPFLLQSMKSGGSLARNARFGAPKSQNGRSFSRFAWQAQDFRSFFLEKLKTSRMKCSFWKLVA